MKEEQRNKAVAFCWQLPKESRYLVFLIFIFFLSANIITRAREDSTDVAWKDYWIVTVFVFKQLCA